MATIDKKLIHFNRKADFEARLAAGEIREYSIVCIKDAKLIWTHGQYYGDLSECLKVTEQILSAEERLQVLENLGLNADVNVQAVDTSESLEDVNTFTFVKYVAQSLTESQKEQARRNIGIGDDLIDLSGYATIDYVDGRIGFINEILEDIING